MTAPSPARLRVVGVRHHSPACARLVAHTIRKVRPRHVLIEGPADMNDRLGELLLGHALPVAIFSFHRGGDGKTETCWTPFCRTSPEWQALVVGREVGASVRFMDLPAWHPVFHGVSNRYGDHERRRARAVEALCRRFHVDGYDALWDHLFEAPAETEDELAALEARLAAYFVAQRGDGEAGGERDGPREDFMRSHVRAALAEGGEVVAVCGGYHAPVLAEPGPVGEARWPQVPASAEAESYLVPWSFHRLDSFTGYEAGMPSPGFYDACFALGPKAAVEDALRAVVVRLRERGQHVSAADLVAAFTLAEGLARVRGHEVLRRTDLLDGLAAALVKGSLDAPLPWSERGVVQRGTDALLVEVLAALSGEREGQLHAATPLPALVGDVERTLAALDLTPAAAARAFELSLARPADLEKSRVLHRLRVLRVPGFRRTRGPQWTTDPILEEQWVVARDSLAESALIEASSFGATLPSAAARRLEEALLAPDLDLGKLAAVLGEAAFIGIDALTSRALLAVREHAAREPDLGRLGEALQRLLGIWTQDVLFGARGSPELGEAVRESFARGLWLLENVAGAAAADARLVGAVRALRDAVRALGAAARAEACAVFHRRAAAADAPPDVRGACLGALWSLGELGDPAAAAETAERAVRQSARPAIFGDFLAGLFGLAREETIRGDGLLAAIDEVLVAMGEPDFLAGLPALRLAFGTFPPREKAEIAQRVAARHGRVDAAVSLLTLAASPEAILRGRALDAEIEDAMRRWALFPTEEAP